MGKYLQYADLRGSKIETHYIKYKQVEFKAKDNPKLRYCSMESCFGKINI